MSDTHSMSNRPSPGPAADPARPNQKYEMWDIARLKKYRENAKVHSAAQVAEVAASIRRFGFVMPILVNAKGIIIAGHCRLESAELLGLPQVPVLMNETLTESEQRAYRLADNRLNESSHWDHELLSKELAKLDVVGSDLIGALGFDDEELAALFAEQVRPSGDQPKPADVDAVPEAPVVPTSRLGDQWVLGRHRLYCGDSLLAGTLDVLLQSNRVDCIFTDPPYNVAYEWYTDEKLTIANDAMSLTDFKTFLQATFLQYRKVMKKGASIYVCHPSSFQREFENAMVRAGLKVRQQIIWAKNTFAWGHGRYKFQHEPIFYAHIDGEKDRWFGDKTQSTLWQFNKPAANRLHPTAKPVELVELALSNSSRQDDTVLDLFGGSGSTLIACERTHRVCRLVELDPKYVDGIVQRWQDLTGREAVLTDTGETFESVRASRAETPA